MSFKKFFAVFTPLLLVIVLFAGVAAYNYPQLYSEAKSGGDKGETKFREATGSFNMLLIGRDRGGKLTDTIMFARVDNDKGTVNILSIPRDTYVDGWKINAMYSIGGIEETIDCVEDIVGLKVDYYVSITTDVFKEIVDELDGVDFEVPQNMDYEDPVQGLYIHLTAGYQHLDGDKAEQLVRFRSYVQGDLQRTQVQRDFMQALISQKKSLKYINKVDDVYRKIAPKIETNFKMKDIMDNIITFKNLNVSNGLKAFMLPNEPRNISGISYVVIDDSGIDSLLETEFGIMHEDRNPRSGRHSYLAGGGSYTSYSEEYSDETAWFEPEIPEDYSGNESGEVSEEDVTSEEDEGYDTPSDSGETETAVDVPSEVIPQPEPEPAPETPVVQDPVVNIEF